MRVGVQFCPGVLYPVPAKDGLLVRIRIPGGMIDAEQLKSVAMLSRAFADGSVEITSRSNLQLRAIQSQNVEFLAGALVVAGLLPSRQHDRVRNIMASPLAGVDAEELMDVRPLVRELDKCLQAEQRFTQLDPKFSFALYGGGRRFNHDRDDIALECAASESGPRFYLSIAGEDAGISLSPELAVPCVLKIALNCIDLAEEASVPVRAKRVLLLPGALNRLLREVGHASLANNTAPSPPFTSEALAGIQTPDHEGFVSISPVIALGRITADQADCLATIAAEYGGDLRLAPWRGILLHHIRENDVTEVIGKLERAALACDRLDGFRGIAACAGSTGCDASLADVRSHAVLLAQRLDGQSTQAEWTVNLSGCEKQCARRHGATAEMIASEAGYTLRIGGALVASSCSPDFALNAIAAAREQSCFEVASS